MQNFMNIGKKRQFIYNISTFASQQESKEQVSKQMFALDLSVWCLIQAARLTKSFLLHTHWIFTIYIEMRF